MYESVGGEGYTGGHAGVQVLPQTDSQTQRHTDTGIDTQTHNTETEVRVDTDTYTDEHRHTGTQAHRHTGTHLICARMRVSTCTRGHASVHAR